MTLITGGLIGGHLIGVGLYIIFDFCQAINVKLVGDGSCDIHICGGDLIAILSPLDRAFECPREEFQ